MIMFERPYVSAILENLEEHLEEYYERIVHYL